jgi:uncharacterized membrane protein YesL
VQSLRLIGRGLSDTLEHLLPFTLLTLAWWLGVLLIVPAPGATVALFAITDPRRAVDRPEWREALLVARANLVRGWKLALPPGIVVLVLANNLAVYEGGTSRASLLVPLWTVLLILTLAVGAYAFAVAAFVEGRPWGTLKRAVFLVGAAPLRAIFVVIALWLIVAAGSVLVVPLFMFVPALAAAIINRVVLFGLNLPVVDPLAPTEERLREERPRRDSHFGP